MSAGADRLLLCRPDRVGDVLITSACLGPLRRGWPQLRVVLAARAVLRPLFEGHPGLDGFVTVPERGGADRAAFVSRLRALDAQTAVHAQPDGPCQWATRRAGIPRRVGYRSGSWFRDWPLTVRRPDHRADGRRHEAEAVADLLAAAGYRVPSLPGGTPADWRPSVHLPAPARDALAAKLRGLGGGGGGVGATPRDGGYLVLNPTAHAADLRWPAESFARVGEVALRRWGVPVVLVGQWPDDPAVQVVRARWAQAGLTGWYDLAGRTDLAELGWLLRAARLLVTRNTGTSHLAAAVGCPLVEVFGRSEPRYGPTRWRALGDPAHTVTLEGSPGSRRFGESQRAYWRRGHAAVSVDVVLRAAHALLGKS